VRDRNRAAQRERLLEAGLECFVERGIANVTVDDITRRAKMAKGSFYRYADDKAALVDALFAPVAAAVEAALDRCDRALVTVDRAALAPVYVALATELAGIVARNLSHVRLYLQEARAAPIPERAPVHRLAVLLELRAIALAVRARKAGLVRAVDDRVVAFTVLGAIEALLHAQLGGRGIEANEIPGTVRALIDLVLGGVRI
jgi:AcrR family transcriptional regulator